jgi:ketosteroid isomerase-like protein
MSQEKVEIIKAAIDAFNRKDWDAFFKDMAPGIELDMTRAVGPVSGVFKLDQIRRLVVELAEHWELARIEPHEIVDAGDIVVVPWTFHVKGRDEIEAAARTTWTFTIREGAIARITLYQERQEALQDLGVLEQDARADSS